MKRISLMFCFFNVMLCFAQNDSVDFSEILNYEDVEYKPYFKNGHENFIKYLITNFKFALNEDESLSGKIETTFIINTDGTIGDVVIIKDLGLGTGEEVKRVLLKAPKWEPGMHNEKLVRVLIKLPIIIKGY